MKYQDLTFAKVDSRFGLLEAPGVDVLLELEDGVATGRRPLADLTVVLLHHQIQLLPAERKINNTGTLALNIKIKINFLLYI